MRVNVQRCVSAHCALVVLPGDVLVYESPLPPESCHLPSAASWLNLVPSNVRKMATCISAASQRTGLINAPKVILG